MAVDKLLPRLPDLIVHKIFRLIPTKLAIRSTIVSKQWASVWSLGVPLLDFDDEGDSTDHDGDNLVRRKLLFIDFVESCMKHCGKKKLLELDSFRLRMRYDSELIGATRIDKWFSFVVDRCVKELDISIQRKDDNDPVKSTYYCIPHTILNAQFLTGLNLEHVRIQESIDLISLPLLKTMSLNTVLFDCRMHSDRSLWMGCPSIEHLSLTSCSFSSLQCSTITVINSSLKFLQVMYCKCVSFQLRDENLESVIFTSEFSQLHSICLLNECVKLKYISIYAQHAKICEIPGTCRDNVKANIDIPNLRVFGYDGYLLPNDVISMKARNPLAALIKLNWDAEEEVLELTFLPPWTHFPTWRDFLQNFDCFDKLELDIRHDAIAEVNYLSLLIELLRTLLLQVLTFSENFRKTFSPPLPNIKYVRISIVRLRCPQTVARVSALINSLHWMAPSATITLNYWDYGPPESSGESSGEDE
ncbi:putative F-box domain, leucine-rich repeat domain, L domain-containing protein [Rosa chinensis]|uniref:Putative F-box domain, leucine-rich repeat domain, L domain-containing protein n=1 Tax=Rosa chinensis TaxID=74649 RepID=A0A2P6RL01_ROSCH|nr:putative F-box domain, leucine-rich repeat domain, L domain-containing protein [Rosa chinensis]